jgi:hypothetical protein
LPFVDEEQDGNSGDGEYYYKEQIAQFRHSLGTKCLPEGLETARAATGQAAAESVCEAGAHYKRFKYYITYLMHQ